MPKPKNNNAQIQNNGQQGNAGRNEPLFKPLDMSPDFLKNQFGDGYGFFTSVLGSLPAEELGVLLNDPEYLNLSPGVMEDPKNEGEMIPTLFSRFYDQNVTKIIHTVTTIVVPEILDAKAGREFKENLRSIGNKMRTAFNNALNKTENRRNLLRKLTDDAYDLREEINNTQNQLNELKKQKGDEYKLASIKKENELYALKDKLKVIENDSSQEGLDRIRKKTGDVINALSFNRMERSLDGYNELYLESKSPVYRITFGFNAHMNPVLSDDKGGLMYRVSLLSRPDSDCPVYDLLLGADEHIQTLMDFWKEKDKGAVSAEKEGQYRQKLYDQSVKMLEMIDKVDKATSDPQRNKELHELGVTDTYNEPYSLNTMAHRGNLMLKATLEAHKAGIENNWGIDDLGILVKFNQLRREIWQKTRSNLASSLSGAKIFDPPRYDSPEQKEYLEKMDALFEKISTTPVRSAEERENLLTSVENLVHEGVTAGIINNNSVDYFGTQMKDAGERSLQIAKGKEAAFHDNVLMQPGVIPADDIDLKSDIFNFAQRKGHVGILLAVDGKADVPYPDDLDLDNPGSPVSSVQAASDELKSIHPVTGSYNVTRLVDPKGFKKCSKILKEEVDKWDKIIDDLAPKDEYGAKAAKLAKATAVSPLKRALGGYSPAYLSVKTPLYDGLDALIAPVNNTITEKTCSNLKKYGEVFPVCDVITETDEHLDTLVDFWKQKDKGLMDRKREELYRRQLHAQATSILNKLDAVDRTAMDPGKHEEIFKAGVLSSNDPFHVTTHAARGSRLLYSTLEAHKTGLENGWAVEDLSALAMFNYIRREERSKYLETNTSHLKEYKVYDKPKYPDDYCKTYFEKMDDLWKKLSESPVKDGGQRAKLLTGIQNLVLEGTQKGYLSKSALDSFAVMYKSSRDRDKLIDAGKQPAFYEGIDAAASKSQDYEMSMFDFEAERSAVFLGRESEYHKNLRSSVTELNELKEKINKSPDTKDIKDEQKVKEINESKEKLLKEYMEKLDEVSSYSKTYQKERKGASTEAGKARLKGAEKIESFADKERVTALEQLNKLRGAENCLNLENYNLMIAGEKANNAFNKLSALEKMPKTVKGMEKLKDLAADVLIGQIANSKVSGNRNSFLKTGANVLKKELKESSEFNKLIESYSKAGKTGEGKDPAGMAEELASGTAMKKLSKLKKKLEAGEGKDKTKTQEEMKVKKDVKAPVKQ